MGVGGPVTPRLASRKEKAGIVPVPGEPDDVEQRRAADTAWLMFR